LTLTRRTSKKYKRQHYIRDKDKVDYFFRDLKKLEEEIHRDQEIQENNEVGES
jgi:hypothetical protein